MVSLITGSWIWCYKTEVYVSEKIEKKTHFLNFNRKHHHENSHILIHHCISDNISLYRSFQNWFSGKLCAKKHNILNSSPESCSKSQYLREPIPNLNTKPQDRLYITYMGVLKGCRCLAHQLKKNWFVKWIDTEECPLSC